MSQEDERHFAGELIDRSGGSLPKSVETIACFGREIWKDFFLPSEASEVQRPGGNQRRIDRDRLTQILATSSTCNVEFWNWFIDGVLGLDLVKLDETNSLLIRLVTLQPLTLARSILGAIQPVEQLSYFVVAEIRRHYDCSRTPELARVFHTLAKSMDELRENDQSPMPVWSVADDLYPRLRAGLESIGCEHTAPNTRIDLFIELCRIVGYVRPHFFQGKLQIRSKETDAEYLLCHLFGLRTSIHGLDDLFGGGGIILCESFAASIGMPGRVVLIKGPFGTGKSLLSLQLASEVARKGGLSWIVPLEQTADECLYALESIRGLEFIDPSNTITDVGGAVNALENAPDEIMDLVCDPRFGKLVIMPARNESSHSILKRLKKRADATSRLPLRLIVLDSMNSLFIDRDLSKRELRSDVREHLREITDTGANILLVAEESQTPDEHTFFEENIADTVIRLTVSTDDKYSQRELEITKSRLQREQRGRHPFSIVPGEGFRIMPSSAAVRARISSRAYSTSGASVPFGLSSLDDILGPDALYPGDLVVIQGDKGTFKTRLGLEFIRFSEGKTRRGKDAGLAAHDEPTPLDMGSAPPDSRQKMTRSLLITARDSEVSARRDITSSYRHPHLTSHKTTSDVYVQSVSHGYVQPGFVFATIASAFRDSHRDNEWVDRVMIDDIAHWELNCPFLRRDETFGDTLVDFLKRQRVTSLMVCSSAQVRSDSVLQQSVIDSADCLIQLSRVQFRGKPRILLRVLKSRGNAHRADQFELSLVNGQIDVSARSSLLRTDHAGNAHAVPVRLFLFSESEAQLEYNRRFAESIRMVVSPETNIDIREGVYLGRAKQMGSFSAVDELQILQTDEFQLPSPHWESSQVNVDLQSFHSELFDASEYFTRMQRRIMAGKERLCAVPYYSNIAFIVHRKHIEYECDFGSWHSIAEKCDAWDTDKKNDAPFFDFPKETDENLNCLFLEILLSQLQNEDRRLDRKPMSDVLRSAEAVEAAKLMWRICSRGYSLSNERRSGSHNSGDVIRVNSKAQVWRHWFTTLRQMCRDESYALDELVVRSLPGDVAVAGEWYLCIPSYSPALEPGLEIISRLCSRDAELERFEIGGGLPVRSAFYEECELPFGDPALTSMTTKDIGPLIDTAFNRSSFQDYASVSECLARFLHGILTTIVKSDENSIVEAMPMIDQEFSSLHARIGFVTSHRRSDE